MSTSTIIHDGEDFVLHHYLGSASYILVTFIGSQQEGSARHDFLLSRLAKKYHIPCLGITCKTRNLYTSKEMDQVISLAAPITRRYEAVVVIGNSIGGYAAMKFSRRLGATHVLAVTPAYSLDEDELSFDSAVERSSLTQDIPKGLASSAVLRDMAIRASDVSGRIVVVHNPQSPVDVHQMRHLRAVIALEGMPLQHQGHNVFFSLERPETMSKIIDALRTSGSAALRREFRTIRRSIPDCIVPSLQHAMRQHPLLVHRALRSDAVAILPGLNGLNHGALSNELAVRMVQCGHQAIAFERIERMIQSRLGKPVRLSADRELGGKVSLQPGRSYLLLSTRGSFLCVPRMTSNLTLSWDPFSNQELSPVFASPSNDGLVLRTMQQDGRASAPLDVDNGETRLDWSTIDGQIVLRSASGFLLAGANDAIQRTPHDSEPAARFLVIPVDEPAALIQRRTAGWLEASEQRLSEGNVLPPMSTSRPRSIGGGLKSLFKMARQGR